MPPAETGTPRDGRSRHDADALRRSRVATVALALLVLAVSIPLGTAAIADEEKDQDKRGSVQPRGAPDYDPTKDPHVQAEVERQRDRMRARDERRRTPEERERRRASRTTFADASDEDALATAQQRFPDAVLKPLWTPPKLRDDERIRQYVNPNAAIVDVPGDKDSYIESTIPIATRSASGEVEPVDLELEEKGDDLVPKNSVARTRFPRNSKDWIALEGAGVRLRYADGGSKTRKRSRDKVFFANVDRDADFFAAPRPDGVETYVQLRSAAATERPTLEFDLPTGADLRMQDGKMKGGVEVVKDGKRLLAVAPAQAIDADGVPVPVELAVHGRRLAMVVPHRDADYKYPILVDPPVVEHFTDPDGPWSLNFENWNPQTHWGGFNFDRFPYWGFDALYTWTNEGWTYTNQEWGQWYFQAYGVGAGAATIVRADFERIGLWPNYHLGNEGAQCVQMHIWPNAYSYDMNRITNTYCSETTGYTFTACYDTENPCAHHDRRGDRGNFASVALMLYYDGRRKAQVTNTTQQVTTTLHDFVQPASNSLIQQTGPAATGRWADTDSGIVRAQATDDGLGMKQFVFWVPKNGGGYNTPTPRHGCASTEDWVHRWSGDRGSSPCPRTWDAQGDYRTWEMPEGRNQIDVSAYDMTHNERGGAYTHVRVDRSQPNALNLGGDVYAKRNTWVNGGPYSLSLGPSDVHSGVRWEQVQTERQGDRPSSDVARDTFNRSTTNGLGTADRGGAWTVHDGPASDFRTDQASGEAKVTKSGDANPLVKLKGTRARDVDAKVKIRLPVVGGQTEGWLVMRHQKGGLDVPHMMVGLLRSSSGSISVGGIERSQNWTGRWMFSQSTGLTQSTDEAFYLRTRLTGDNPTRLQARVWRVGTAEPSTWNVDIPNYVPLAGQNQGTVGLWTWDNAGGAQTTGFGDLTVRSEDGWVSTDWLDRDCDTLGCTNGPNHRTATWHTSDYDDGPVRFRVRATDPLGSPEGGPTNHFRDEIFTVKLDRTRPTLDSIGGDATQNNKWIAPGQSYSIDVDTSDLPATTQSGVQEIKLEVNGAVVDTKPGDPISAGVTCNNANGCHTNPGVKRLTWNVPPNHWQATNTVKVYAVDAATNRSLEHTRTVYVDSLNPFATQISGTLRSARDKAVRGSSFSLHVDAEDGSTLTPSSGVRQIKLFSGRSVGNWTERLASTAQGCPPDNCKQTWDTTFAPTSGDETRTPRRFRVRVGDQVNNGSDSPPHASRISRWRLNEGTGAQLARDWKGSNDGTYTGGPTLGQAGATTDGDKAVALNGTSAYVNVGNPANLQISNGTVEAWVKAPNPGSGHRGIVTKQFAYGLFLLDGMVAAHDWSTGQTRSTGIALTDGDWHHVAMSFRSGVTNGTVIYIDGVARLTTTMTVSNQGTGLQIGSGGGGAQLLNGTVDEASVHSAPLDAGEIARLYSSEPADWRIAQWRLGESSGTFAADSSIDPQLVPNPGFEANTYHWHWADGAFLGPAPTVTRVADSRAPEGGYVAKVVTPAAQHSGLGTDFQVEAGHRYRVRVKLKREAGGSPLRIALGERTAPHEELPIATGANPSASGFTEVTGLVTPSRSGLYRLYVRVATNPASVTTFYVDEATVTEEASGTYAGGYTLGQPGATAGGDNAVKFNGTSGYVDLPFVHSAAGPFSVEAWVKVDGFGGDQTIVSQRDGGGGVGRSLLYVQAATNRFVSNLGGVVRDSGFAAQVGRWHHVVFAYSGPATGAWQFYVDGAQRATGTGATGEHSTGGWIIGANKLLSAGGFFNGTLDDVAVYPAALSGAEVGRLNAQQTYDWEVVFDNGQPTLDPLEHSPGSTWHSLNSPPRTVKANSYDAISGVKLFKLFTPRSPSGEDVQTKTFDDCSVNVDDLCDTTQSHTFTYDAIPDGANQKLRVVSQDPVTNESAERAWFLRVDRTRPTIDQRTGDMAIHNQWVRPDKQYTLNVDTSDNLSGVRRIDFYVDGVKVASRDGDNCVNDQCAVNPPAKTFNWTPPATGPNTHALKVVAVDAATNESLASTWTVRVDRDRPGLTTSGPLKDAKNRAVNGSQYDLRAVATDTGSAPNSGITHIRLLVGADESSLILRETSPVRTDPADNEPMTHDFRFFPTADDESRDARLVRVETFDEAGHRTWEDWEVVFDRGKPQLQAVTHEKAETHWFNATGVQKTRFDTYDAISGVRSANVRVPREGGGEDVFNGFVACTGMLPDLCPQDPPTIEVSYGAQNAPNGVNDAYGRAVDSATNQSDAANWKFRVDKEPPQLRLSGLLWDQRDLVVVTGDSDLQIDATDGDRATPATQRSGMGKIEVYIKREAEAESEYDLAYDSTQDCDHPQDSCPMSRSWIFRSENWEDDEYRVRVDATDDAGNKTSQSFKFRVGPATLQILHELGLEDFWQFHSVPTGGGTSAHVNVATGNVIWHSTPVVNPGRGLSSVVNLTYNSQGETDDAVLDYNEAGEGFSLGVSGITRLNEPLDVRLAAANGPVYLTDPDGTRHEFTPSGQLGRYLPPPGVHLHLRRFSEHAGPVVLGDPRRAWAATRPDGITYFFDNAGYPTSIEDRNGNVIRFDYEYLSVVDNDQPCEIVAPLDGTAIASELCRRRLVRVVDPVGAEAANPDLTVEGEPGEDTATMNRRSIHVCYFPDVVESTTGVPGTGPVRRLRDHAGRITAFEYDNSRYLTAMVQAQKPTEEDAPGYVDSNNRPADPDCRNTDATPEDQAEAERIFRFRYESAEVDPDNPLNPVARRYLTAVVDPRHASQPDRMTSFEYEDREELGEVTDLFERRRVLNVRDRGNETTGFTYAEGENTRQATIRNARGFNTIHEVDERARPRRVTDAVGTDTVLTWDDQTTQDNNVISLTEAANRPGQSATTHMKYNLHGQLVRHQDPVGNVTTFGYREFDGMHRAPSGADVNQVPVSDLTTMTDARGNAPGGNPDEHTWRFYYDVGTPDGIDDDERRGNPRAQVDPEGNVARTDFTPRGLVEREVDFEDPGDPNDPQNQTLYSNFDESGFAREKVDPRNNRWLFCYDAVGNMRRATDPRGATPGDPCLARATYTSTFTYDQLDRVRTERMPKDSESGEFIDRSYQWTVNDNLEVASDGNGAVTTREWTERDELLRVTSPAVPHHGEAGNASEVTEFEYDEVGNLARVTRPMGVAANAPDGRHPFSTQYVYDQLNRKVQETKQGWVAASGGDPERTDSLVTSVAYDFRGNLVGVTDPERNGDTGDFLDRPRHDATRRFAYEYDLADRRTRSIEDPGGLRLITEYTHDENDNVESITDPRAFDARDDDADGNPNDDDDLYRTRYEFDGRDLPIAEVKPGNRRTEWQLRADGRLAREIRPKGVASGAAGDFEVEYDYYPTGDLRSRTLPQAEHQYSLRAGAIFYHRDQVGDPIRITDARAAAQADFDPEQDEDPRYTFTNDFYDTGDLRWTDRPSWWGYSPGGGGKQVSERGPGAQQKSNHPEPGSETGSERLAADRRGGDTETPGDFGFVSSQEMPGVLPPAGRTHFEYDDEMRLTDVIAVDGHRTEINHDALGRLRSVRAPFAGANTINTSYEYDRNGNRRLFRGPLDTDTSTEHETETEYDQFDRVIRETAPGSRPALGSAATRSVTEYDYDRNGNVEFTTTPRGTATDGPDGDFRYEYDYDAVDRVTAARNPRAVGALVEQTSYEYDAAGNQTLVRSPRGNRIAFTPGGPGDGACNLGDNDTERDCFETEATFNGNNELLVSRDGHGEETRFRYDLHGNQTRVDAPGGRSGPDDNTDDRQVTTRNYDGRDLLWTQTLGTGGDALTTVTEYDANGNLRRVINPRGTDDDGTNQDPARLADTGPQITNPASAADRANTAVENASRHATVSEFSPDNVLTAVHLPWNDPGGDDQTVRDDDQTRYRQNFWVDDEGRATAVDSAYVWEGRDADEQEARHCNDQPDANPNDDGCEGRTRYTYFDNGWIETVLDPTLRDNAQDILDSGRRMVYRYDDAGNQTLWRSENDDGPHREIRRSYHPNNLVETREADHFNSTTQERRYHYTYNRNGGLERLRDEDLNRTTTIVRDGMERELAVNEEHDSSADGEWENDTWTRFDVDGNPTWRRTDGDIRDGVETPQNDGDYTGGKTTRYEYDALGRETLTQVERPGRATRLFRSEYYPSGQRSRRVKENLPQGSSEPQRRVTRRFFIDSAGRMVRKERDAASGDDGPNHNYRYDDNGNRIADERGEHTFNSRHHLINWDPRGPRPAVTYRVNGSGAVTHQRENGVTTTFHHEGERLVRAETSNGADPVEYCYTPFGSLRSIQNQDCDQNPGSDDTSYVHDEFDRLIEARVPTRERSRYTYDGLDRRDQKCRIRGTASDGNQLSSVGACNEGRRSDISYVGTSSQISQEQDAGEREPDDVDAGRRTRTYDYDSGGERLGFERRHAQDTPGDEQYRSYETDANGSVVGVEGENGEMPVSDRYEYDPFGELQRPTADGQSTTGPVTGRNHYENGDELGLSPMAQENPFRYQGHYYDSGVKLYDMGARSYRPDTARFLTQDRFEAAGDDFNLSVDPLTQNRYAFAGGNPVNNVEWDGHCGVNTCEAAGKCPPRPRPRAGVTKSSGGGSQPQPRPFGMVFRNANGTPMKPQPAKPPAPRAGEGKKNCHKVFKKVCDGKIGGGGDGGVLGIDLGDVKDFVNSTPAKIYSYTTGIGLTYHLWREGVAMVDHTINQVGAIIEDIKHGRWGAALGKTGLLVLDFAGKRAGNKLKQLGEKVGIINKPPKKKPKDDTSGPTPLPNDVKQAAEAHITDSGRTVIGPVQGRNGRRGYRERAQERGDSYFDIGPKWDKLDHKQQWEANKHFLDKIADRGDTVVLSTPKNELTSRNKGTLREIEHLRKERGYRWVNQWTLAPG